MKQSPLTVPLIKNGKMLRRNMRQELITEDELMMQLCEQGLDDVSKVKESYIESDGRISVIQYKEKRHERVERKEP